MPRRGSSPRARIGVRSAGNSRRWGSGKPRAFRRERNATPPKGHRRLAVDPHAVGLSMFRARCAEYLVL
ncbi:MAG: hypothetical protein MUC94_04320 [bacterium]|nr:hypothetical protein [bacterium]